MAERVTDVRDVRDRIVADLTGQGEPGVPSPAVPSVLLADDLAPADTAGLDPSRVIGLATRLGGTTSHTAIIARQLGLPCVVAVGGLDDVPEGATVLLDGEQGTVTVDPDPADAEARFRAARVAADELATTPDRPHERRARGAGARQRPGRRRGARGRRRARGGRRPVPHGVVVPRARPGAHGGGAGGRLRGGARRLRGAQGRAPHPGRRLGQAAGLRHAAGRGQPGTGRPGPAHRPARPRHARPPADAVAEAAWRTSSTPW